MSQQPDYIQWTRYNGITEYIFYFGVPDGRSELLDEGTQFDCIYSPSPNQRHPHWRKVRFQVTYVIGRTNEWERWYTEKQRRELTADEIAQCEAWIAGLHSRKVAIVGSRDYPRLEDVREFVAALPGNTVVISGGARGVDTVAEEAARARGLDVQIFPADWNTYGKSAGFRRNADIVNAADEVVAFSYRDSKGTANTIERARRAGKPVRVIEAA